MSSKSCLFAQRQCQQRDSGTAEIYVYGLKKQKSRTSTSRCSTDKDQENLDGSKTQDRIELFSNSSSEDRYILVKSNKRQRISGNATRSNGALLERVSTPGRRENVRLFRCSRTDLPDFVEWLEFQQTDSYSIYQQPSIMKSGSSDILSETEFGRCRSTIGCLLQSRTVADLQLILLACYFVANSLRSLSVRELVSAVHRIANTRFQGDSDFLQEQQEYARERKLLKMTSTIIRTDDATKVTFTVPSMKIFLKRVALPGIERGHGTMAEMCLSEIRRLGSAFVVRPWHKFRTWFSSSSKWPLMQYVSKYWSCHIREAVTSSPKITAELFRMINQGVVGRSPSDTPIHLQRQVVEIGHSISAIYDLPQLTELYEKLGATGDKSPLDIPSEAEIEDLEHLSQYTLSPKSLSTTEYHDQPTARRKYAPCEDARLMSSDFDTLRNSCQGRRRSYSKPQDACSLVPEDKDWEQIDRPDSDSHRQVNEYRPDGWDIITREDYAME